MDTTEKTYFELLYSASPNKNLCFVINVYNICKYVYFDEKVPILLLNQHDANFSYLINNISLFMNIILRGNGNKNKILKAIMLLWELYKYFPSYLCEYLVKNYKMCDSYDTFLEMLKQHNYNVEIDNVEIDNDNNHNFDTQIILPNSKYDYFVTKYNKYLKKKSATYVQKIFDYLELCFEKRDGIYVNYHLWRLCLNEPVVKKCFKDNGISLIKAININKYILNNIYLFDVNTYLPESPDYWQAMSNLTNKKLFISIPKTATCSIQAHLTQSTKIGIDIVHTDYIDKKIDSYMKTYGNNKTIQSALEFDVGYFGHLPAKYYNTNKDNLVTCCRNPYDRAISAYNFVCEMGFYPNIIYFLIRICYRNFYEWSMYGLSVCLNPVPTECLKDFKEALYPQHMYVLDNNGDLIIKKDNIMRYENLNEDFAKMFGSELTCKFNVSHRKKNNYNETNAKQIYNLYKKDFEIFDYDESSYIDY